MLLLTKDLARKLAEREGLTLTQAFAIVTSLIAIIRDELKNGVAVRLTMLGTLAPFNAKARNYRSPKTGEVKALAERNRVKLKMADPLVKYLNEK